jgi:hypothetical protein
VAFDPVTARTVRVTIESVREVATQEYYSNTPIVTPAALAELGIPGVQRPALAESLPGTCRDDLLTVDGAPIPVRVTGSVADATAGRPLAAEPCDPTTGAAVPSSLSLGRGQHIVRTALGVDAGVDLDGIVLGSEAGGAPLILGARGAVPSAQSAGDAPEVETVSSGRTSTKLRVTGADAPFWLVLGESHNRGWVASVDGHDLGEGELVNGYANGWLVDPKDARTLDVTLTWTPQRTVWIALAISGLMMLLCTALALGLVRRRRKAQSAEPTKEVAEAMREVEEPPAFRSPLVAAGTRPRGLVVALTAVGAGLVAAVLIKPLPGLLVGLLVLAALVRPRWRVVLAVGAPIALGAAGLYVLLEQTLEKYPPVFEWPTFFDRVHVLGWLAVVFLAADALVEIVRTRRHPGMETPEHSDR